mmetsp:Transcript_60954/g.145254  ORF Transcript_60954/g.145254 Transcript_60954/m.145254 type:complete len:169 (-) Transcript_60954:108-614(-)
MAATSKRCPGMMAAVSLAPLLLVANLVAIAAAAASQQPSKADVACAACQSAAQLLVKTRKELTSGKEALSIREAVNTLLTNRTTYVCSEQKMQPHADFLGYKAKTMAKRCEAVVPEKPEYKSAQDLKKLLLEKAPRSQVAKAMCLDSGLCTSLWTKEQEPWSKGKQEL